MKFEERQTFLGKKLECLDKGFVRLVDVMGDDSSIVQAARVSYGVGTKTISEDRGLIRYLMRNQHTSPFEMVEFKFHVKLPIFVARQWIRHRTANVNEYSGRYSEMINDFYLPAADQLRTQSLTNKQGRSDVLFDNEKADKILGSMSLAQEQSYEQYKSYLADDLARELARINLPLSTYTEWYWKIDLHNLFHFLRLRLDQHAQYEIRVYGEKIVELIKPFVPLAYEAFEDYILNSANFSAIEMNILKSLVNTQDLKNYSFDSQKMSKREIRDFLTKFGIDK